MWSRIVHNESLYTLSFKFVPTRGLTTSTNRPTPSAAPLDSWPWVEGALLDLGCALKAVKGFGRFFCLSPQNDRNKKMHLQAEKGAPTWPTHVCRCVWPKTVHLIIADFFWQAHFRCCTTGWLWHLHETWNVHKNSRLVGPSGWAL